MNNDLSDEAFELWARDTFELRAHKPTWQECRRRCEAQIEEYERKLMSIKDDLYAMIQTINANTEFPDCFYDLKEGRLINKDNFEEWLLRHPEARPDETI